MQQKFFFDKNFYPTPHNVIQLMEINCSGMNVFEPHGGKGDIIDYVKNHGAASVVCCELNEDLAEICKSKARFLKYDFFNVTSDEISHVNLIVMNPPFDKAEKHILHAWEIAPEGCEIISLLNTETIDNFRRGRREELAFIVDTYGNSKELGEVFSTAERKTNVKVSVLHLYKPMQTQNTNFEGFYMDAEPNQNTENTEGIMPYNEIQALVNSYIGSLKCFDDFDKINDRMNTTLAPLGVGNVFTYEISYDKKGTSKVDFANQLQVKAWELVFKKMNITKYVTKGVRDDINNFVRQQHKVPFTVKNVYRMLEIIVGTRENTLNRALVEAVDNFTKHTHENRFGVEGWKTNSGYMLNEKFIVDWIFEVAESYSRNAGKLTTRYNSNAERIDDLIKVMCNLTGSNYDNHTDLNSFVGSFEGLEAGRWYCWGFFEIKGFKKGTLHIKFQDRKHWEMLNRAYAKIKGEVIPEKI